MLSRMFRILHPVHYVKRRIKRAIVPRPIRRAKWITGGVAHPISRVRYSPRRGVIRKLDTVITPKRKPRRKERGGEPGVFGGFTQRPSMPDPDLPAKVATKPKRKAKLA